MKPFMWSTIVKFFFFALLYLLYQFSIFFAWGWVVILVMNIFGCSWVLGFFFYPFLDKSCMLIHNFFHQSLAIYQIPRKMLDTRIWKILIDGWQRLWSLYWLRTSKGVAVCDRTLLFYNPIVVAQVNASLRGVNPCPYQKTITRMV